jgi:serine/threonine protein phosphatase PrpC
VTTTGMRLRAGATTRKGPGRDRNEDVYAWQLAHGLFVVCDGMGGTTAGDVASQMAASTILRELRRPAASSPDDGIEPGKGAPQSCRLEMAVRESNRLIYIDAQMNTERAHMGTTVVGAWLHDGIVSIAHVGDSRAYLWRADELATLTEDHTLLVALKHEGLDPSERDLEADPRDVLLRVVGGEPDVEIDVVEIPLHAGDYLVLCTDGLSRVVTEAIVNTSISRLRDPQRICDHLVDTALRDGGTDDITVLTVEVVDTGTS